MEVISTGIPELDLALGGGLVKGGLIVVSYESDLNGSAGWILGLKIFKNRIDNEDLGILINHRYPLSKLFNRLSIVGLNAEVMLREGRLKILDVFGSQYDIKYPYEGVKQFGSFDPKTYIPKMVELFEKLLTPAQIENSIGAIFTTGAFAMRIGEERYMEIIEESMAFNEKLKLEKGISFPTRIYFLNKDEVSPRFSAWLSSIADQVISISSHEVENRIGGKLRITKSILPNFELKSFRYWVVRGGIEIL
ncbi:hypothetical protein [Thermococcus sp. LS2]|uniref:hypothetical protein n=1 Tax=Thermococcus sp. LS2 TaxID=1638260 RepID=UPI00143A488D|nr:hypothetical protein [Thermococcus sp. LS2]NJE12257.1 hypothetical protein [Thermococcus sp. LS2]